MSTVTKFNFDSQHLRACHPYAAVLLWTSDSFRRDEERRDLRALPLAAENGPLRPGEGGGEDALLQSPRALTGSTFVQGCHLANFR